VDSVDRFRSSIFSFDTLRAGTVPAGWLASVSLAVVLVIAAELVARMLLAPLGGFAWAYWSDEAAVKYESYRRMAAAGAAPDVVVIGDSTAARDFDPVQFERAAGGLSAYNLGWPGNFALALYESVAPLFIESGSDDPRIVVLMQAYVSYTQRPVVQRFERPILNSWVVRNRQDPTALDQRIALLRLYPAARKLKRYWLDGDASFLNAVPKNGGFMPKGGSGGPELGSADGQDATTGAVDVFDPERRATLDGWAAIAKARGFDLLVIVPPWRERPAPAGLPEHVAWLRDRAADHDVAVLDLSGLPVISDREFRDAGHLSPDGAGKLSRLLGRAFGACAEHPDELAPCVADWVRTHAERIWPDA
jgi:hypothetical protein